MKKLYNISKVIATMILLAFSCSLSAQDLIVTDANTTRSNKSRGGKEFFKPKTGLGLGLQAGSALPIGTFNGEDALAGPGFSTSALIDYNWKTYGLGLEAGGFSNSIDDKLDDRLNYLELPTERFITSNRWQSTYVGMGPSATFGKQRVKLQLSARAGMLSMTSPEFIATTEVFNQDLELYNYPAEKFTIGYYNLGGTIIYPLSRNWGLNLGVNYLSGINSSEYTYTYRDLSIHGDPPYGEAEVFESPIVEKTFKINPTTLHIKAGVTYTFGRETSVEVEPPSPINTFCYPVELMSPVDQMDLYTETNAGRTGGKSKSKSAKGRPDFEWNESTYSEFNISTHVFKLYDENDTLLFEERTKKTGIKHSSELEKIYQTLGEKLKNNSESIPVYWVVETEYESCESQESEKRKINILKSPDGMDITIRNIMCDTSAFDSPGMVRYTGTVELSNDSDNNSQLQVKNLSDLWTYDQNGNGMEPITTLCSSSQPTFPITLNPGDVRTFCITFERPLGDIGIELHADYKIGTSSSTAHVYRSRELPNCVCTSCDNWTIRSQKDKFIEKALFPSNYEISTSIRIINAAPILEVRAEIISVQHNVKDPMCYNCTQQDDNMGMFNSGTLMGLSQVGGPGPWQNNGNGVLSDDNSDVYANHLIWKAADPTVGVNFGVALGFKMQINLPKSQLADCCQDEYKVCIRFVFTDINCQTCEKFICFEYGQDDDGGGTGNHNRPQD